MYVIDFFKNLFRKSNVGVIIYLALNLLFLMIIFSGDGFAGVLMVLMIYFISLALALSPVGEFILRLQVGARKIKRKDISGRILPLFNNAYQRAKEKDPNINSGINLFMNSDNAPNALATGRKTVCITKGLLSLPDEEIEAILSHEFAHLSHKDTDLLLVVGVGNYIVVGILLMFRVFATITAAISSKSFLTTFITSILIGFFIWIWTKIGLLLVMHSSRKNEYEADKFAFDLGYGEQLASALDKLGDQKPQAGFLRAIHSTHPNIDDRIAQLQEMGVNYSM